MVKEVWELEGKHREAVRDQGGRQDELEGSYEKRGNQERSAKVRKGLRSDRGLRRT